MGPDLGLTILVPAAPFGLVTIICSARQEHEIEQQRHAQATSCSNPIWPPASNR